MPTLAYPGADTPEDRPGEPSALCSFGETPRLLTGVLRHLFLQHFADVRNIHNGHLRRIMTQAGPWQPGERTGLYIESLANWKPELAEFRPGIVIKEGEWRWRRVSIGDSAGLTVRDGKYFYAGLWDGSHTVFALGNEGAETQILATEVAKLLLWTSQLLVQHFDLHRFVLVSVGALSALEESTENYVVPIQMAYTKEEGWSVQEDAPRLKRLTIKPSQDEDYPA